MIALKSLYFDCFSGAAGDMILGALIDAGVPLEEVLDAIGRLAIAPDTIWTNRVTRAGVSATKFCVRGEDDAPGVAAAMEPVHSHGAGTHHHDHLHGGDAEPDQRAARGAAHPHDHAHAQGHAHRSLAEIERLIDRSALDAPGRDRAKHLFRRLGAAEAEIHGTPLDRVHLHEVGALDSIIDVVGSVYALGRLGADRIVSSPLNVGGGTIRSAHGVYPVPAPATTRLLEGAPIYAGRQQTELVTPTGALLITDYASAYGPVPAMRLARTGYGAGARDFADTPNVLRVLIGDADPASTSHTVVVVEAEIDDMNPQIFGLLMDRLLAAGALDVFYTPIQMKKNRPGTMLSVIAAPDMRRTLTEIIFRETTTIGVRYSEITRECLDREVLPVETPLGTVRFKVARRDGELFNASPEFDDCVRIARERNVPLKDVQAAATKAFLDQRGR
jgi:uncharacterized protein (TIGR00299 family) protein